MYVAAPWHKGMIIFFLLPTLIEWYFMRVILIFTIIQKQSKIYTPIMSTSFVD